MYGTKDPPASAVIMSCALRAAFTPFNGSYSAERLQHFPPDAPHLRGLRPTTLQLDHVTGLDLPWGAMRGPSDVLSHQCRRYLANASYAPRGYNPSVVRAPIGLCERCMFVAAVRVDAQHGCDAGGAIQRGFAGTAILALDESLAVLAWTWWYNNPSIQMKGAAAWGLEWDEPSTIFGQSGDSKGQQRRGQPLPWPQTQYDVRLLNVRGAILATHQCRHCHAFSITLVQLHADVHEASGRVERLMAWSDARRDILSWHPHSNEGWSALAGTNQALFTEVLTEVRRTHAHTHTHAHTYARTHTGAYYLSALHVRTYRWLRDPTPPS